MRSKVVVIAVMATLLSSMAFAQGRAMLAATPDPALKGQIKDLPKLSSAMAKTTVKGSASSTREAFLFKLGSNMEMVSLGYDCDAKTWVDQFLPLVREDLIRLGVSPNALGTISGIRPPSAQEWESFSSAIIKAAEKDPNTEITIYAGMWVTKVGVLSLAASKSDGASDMYQHFRLELAPDFQKYFSSSSKVSRLFGELSAYNGQTRVTRAHYTHIVEVADQIIDELSAT